LAGIYIHIPFCKQACNYCDFHFSTSLKNKLNLVEAICREIVLRKDYLNQQTIGTIYFGGGTPSLLSKEELMLIFETIHANFSVDADVEITLEANPDDLSKEYLAELKQTPVNRLSIGIQSFNDADLKWMNRAHHSQQAVTSVMNAAEAGFNNISIDLIYGVPEMTIQHWKDNLQKALQLPVQHLSSYSLTVEPKTALGHFVKKAYIKMPEDETTALQFKTLAAMTADAGFIHYEISNLCKPGYFSRHNTSYWKGIHYLGIGPSAHSYNGISREWNAANNALYIESLTKNERVAEKEILTPANIFNEYIMVSLRTMWGIDIDHVKKNHGNDYAGHLLSGAAPYLKSGELILKENKLLLSPSGQLIADRLASDLFI
jgi:oxygen-independent coproporphyrinogen III oxidase